MQGRLESEQDLKGWIECNRGLILIITLVNSIHSPELKNCK